MVSPILVWIKMYQVLILGGRLCDSQKDFDLYSNILKNLSAEPRYVLRSSVPNCKSESWDYKVFYDEIFPVTKDSHKLQAANTVRLAFSMFDTRVKKYYFRKNSWNRQDYKKLVKLQMGNILGRGDDGVQAVWDRALHRRLRWLPWPPLGRQHPLHPGERLGLWELPVFTNILDEQAQISRVDHIFLVRLAQRKVFFLQCESMESLCFPIFQVPLHLCYRVSRFLLLEFSQTNEINSIF